MNGIDSFSQSHNIFTAHVCWAITLCTFQQHSNVSWNSSNPNLRKNLRTQMKSLGFIRQYSGKKSMATWTVCSAPTSKHRKNTGKNRPASLKIFNGEKWVENVDSSMETHSGQRLKYFIRIWNERRLIALLLWKTSCSIWLWNDCKFVRKFHTCLKFTWKYGKVSGLTAAMSNTSLSICMISKNVGKYCNMYGLWTRRIYSHLQHCLVSAIDWESVRFVQVALVMEGDADLVATVRSADRSIQRLKVQLVAQLMTKNWRQSVEDRNSHGSSKFWDLGFRGNALRRPWFNPIPWTKFEKKNTNTYCNADLFALK